MRSLLFKLSLLVSDSVLELESFDEERPMIWQLLDLVLLPPLHVFVQEDQFDQAPHVPNPKWPI